MGKSIVNHRRGAVLPLLAFTLHIHHNVYVVDRLLVDVYILKQA